MSRPLDSELADFDFIADELREVFVERGHRVAEALAVDPAFGSGTSRSSLARDLAIEAVSRAASERGVDFRPVNGTGREFRCLTDNDRRYRFLKGARNAKGDLLVTVNSESTLAVDGDDSLFGFEQWAIVYLVDDGLVAEVVASDVLGTTGGSPGQLNFGVQIALGASSTSGPGRRFIPNDDGLDEFFSDDGQGEASHRSP